MPSDTTTLDDDDHTDDDTYDGGEAGDADDDVMIAAVVVTKMKTSTTMMIGTATVVTNVACLHLPAMHDLRVTRSRMMGRLKICCPPGLRGCVCMCVCVSDRILSTESWEASRLQARSCVTMIRGCTFWCCCTHLRCASRDRSSFGACACGSC